MKRKSNLLATALVVLVSVSLFLSIAATRFAFAQGPGQLSPQKREVTLDDRVVADALCPIVYQVDRSASARGYRYIFYGDGFFVNKDGYLLTAAHVLSQLHDGQPFLLLRSRAMPPRFVPTRIVAIDREHDVAILLATPNPFDATRHVSFLPLARENPQPGSMVLLAALRPFKPRDAYTLEPALEERSPGEVLGFEFSQLEKGHGDTELLLFNHGVQPGQSGAPVISLDSDEVVGLVEGQWLRGDMHLVPAAKDPIATDGVSAVSGGVVADVPGAVIPIHYAIALLQQKAIAWHSGAEADSGSERTEDEGNDSAQGSWPPAPLSLVPAPYPSESLSGAEVMLDALVSRSGTVSDVKVVRGEQPFLDKALGAVRTWTFVPARSGSLTASARVAIVFQFAQPYVPPRGASVHYYDQDSWGAAQDRWAPGATARDSGRRAGSAHDRGALPLATVEAAYPATSSAEGSVMLYERIDRQGRVATVQVVRALEPLTAPTVAAAHGWHFAPATKMGSAIDSAAVVVVAFRRPFVTKSEANSGSHR